MIKPGDILLVRGFNNPIWEIMAVKSVTSRNPLLLKLTNGYYAEAEYDTGIYEMVLYNEYTWYLLGTQYDYNGRYKIKETQEENL